MRCPSCGFETPDRQDWCDFCKQPFRKQAEERPGAPGPTRTEAPLTPEAAFALLKSDPGERIREMSPIVRFAAWVFLGVVVLWIVFLSMLSMRRMRADPGGPEKEVFQESR